MKNRKKGSAKTPTLRAYLNPRPGADENTPLSITLQFTYQGKAHKYQPGISVPPCIWNKKKQAIREGDERALFYPREVATFKQERLAFAKYILGGLEIYDQRMDREPSLNAWDCIWAFEERETEKASLYNFLNSNIEYRFTRGAKKVDPRTVKKRETLLRYLREFEGPEWLGRPFTAADLTRDGRDWFVEFLYTKRGRRADEPMTARSVNKYLSQIQSIARRLAAEGVEVAPFVEHVEFQEYAIHKTGRYPTLNEEDLKALGRFNPLKDPRAAHIRFATRLNMQRVIDGFLICAQTGNRWKDYLKMKPERFPKPYLFHYVEDKGKKQRYRELIIPVPPKAQEILSRYNYHCPTGNLSGPAFNRIIKEAAKLAGLNRPCTFVHMIHDGERRREERPLHEAITHHCGRVTTTTNLRRKGFTDDQIAGQTGHSLKKSMIEHYDRSSLMERGERTYRTLYGEPSC